MTPAWPQACFLTRKSPRPSHDIIARVMDLKLSLLTPHVKWMKLCLHVKGSTNTKDQGEHIVRRRIETCILSIERGFHLYSITVGSSNSRFAAKINTHLSVFLSCLYTFSAKAAGKLSP